MNRLRKRCSNILLIGSAIFNMDLRTIVKTTPSPEKITYINGAMFIGSCFASSIGSQMEKGRMPVMINPAGSVYNPVSVCNTLDTITSGKEFVIDDLYNNNGTWLSFFHYTDFSSDNPLRVLDKINSKSVKAMSFLKNAGFLFITFGTARVYRLRKTGQIVSNCHKLPSSDFESDLLSVNEITELWSRQLDTLHRLFPKLKIVFTISPVRHWKDGAHGNQISKSILFLAVEELLSHPAAPGYFPAYEMVIDDLRDYRFYKDDMLHPSSLAIDYIWEAFTESFIEKNTIKLYNEVVKITMALNHRLNTDSDSKIRDFALQMKKKISELEAKAPEIDFTSEKKYFQDLLNNMTIGSV